MYESSDPGVDGSGNVRRPGVGGSTATKRKISIVTSRSTADGIGSGPLKNVTLRDLIEMEWEGS